MAAKTLADAPENAIQVVYGVLDDDIAISTETLQKLHQQMDEIAKAAMLVALAQIAKAAGGS
ncbi:hypothetical protein PPSIR1_06441 [Plesiocystis pacifica SIR-1]|uniref:Uncharacterized protein n=1 Tax=Plesiocystis pacifica SIR-1 TaxID=391625 RepID=A6GHZ8_9BACT|nr:hypothetical protein [Plesiocystis pacifica]EDM74505.1 hypothetical protein PPSIR1_06441 [Plesiocystis pacifica SIR-1]